MRARHLSDSELLRLVDNDGSEVDLGRLRAHLAGCGHCEWSLAALQRDSSAVSAWITQIGITEDQCPAICPAEGTVDPHAHHATPKWLRAAVLLLAIAGLVGAVQPLRARVVRWLSRSWAELTQAEPAPPRPDATSSTAPTPVASAILWYTPSGPELRISIASRQESGALLVQPASGPTASLEISPHDPAAVPLASERGLEVRNAQSSRSDYVLQVPSVVRQVVINIGSEPPRVMRWTPSARAVRFDLRGDSSGSSPPASSP